MSRPIKYRGKRLDNGEWEYGYYHRLDSAKDRNKAYIIPSYASALYSFEVDPETVGQVVKKQGEKELYDGDVVRYPDAYMNCGEDGDWEEIVSVGEIKWDEEEALYYVTNRQSIDMVSFWEAIDEVEVIGNRFDHPHLLKGDDTDV